MRCGSLLRFAIGLVALASLGAARQLEGARLVIGNATASAGGTVKVPITLASEGTQFIQLFLTVSAPGLTFVSGEPGPGGIAAGKVFVPSGGPGSASVGFKVPVFDVNDPSFLSVIGDGLFATMTFSVDPGTAGPVTIGPFSAQAAPGNSLPDGMVVFADVVPGTVTIGCGPPGAAAFTSSSATLTAGQSYAATWSAAPGISSSGSYVLETSRAANFATIASTITTRSTSALVPTQVSGDDTTLLLRVRGVQGGCGAAGPNSGPVTLTARGLPDSFVATSTDLALTGAVGDLASKGVAGFRNVGGRSGTLNLSTSGSFDVSPSSLSLGRGEGASVSVTARASALTAPAILQGSLVAAFGTQTIRLPITLSVAPRPASSREGTRLSASPLAVTFTAPSGQSPERQTVRLTLQPQGSGPLYLSAAIGPGGSWLVPPPELGSQIPSSNELTLTLAVNRANRSVLDGIPPLTTLLTLTPVGGAAADAIVIQVQDVETLPVNAGNDRRSIPPAGTSFIVPSTVKAQGLGNAVFTSDGWLKNQSSAEVAATFYFTPDGRNGLTDPSVRKAEQVIPTGATLRLSDLVSSLFQGSGVSGQVEVRSGTPNILSLRTSVEAVTGGEPSSRYGTEMPVVAFGAGVGKDRGELVLPGIDDDEARRANVILAETTGADATARIVVFDAAGQTVGETSRDLSPYSKVQVNGLVQAVRPGASLTGGSAAVSVTAGTGSVVAIATIIDNRSNSFSAVEGQAVRSTVTSRREALDAVLAETQALVSLASSAAGASFRGASIPLVAAASAGTPAPLAAGPSLILPSVARLTGAGNTRFTTRIALVNGTAQPATLSMTYQYIDVADGNQQKSIQRSVVIPPRGGLPPAVADDVIANLFGLTNPTFGWMQVTGDVASVMATTAVSAQVDPNDPAKGVKTAQVGGLLSDSPDVLGSSEEERRFAGAEKSVQKRTNLALVETLGAPAHVVVRAYSTSGLVLAESAYDLGPSQYFQITDAFGTNGVGLGEGPFQNVELTVQVTSGSGRVVGVASVIDNVSRNPQLFVLKGAGPPPPAIGF